MTPRPTRLPALPIELQDNAGSALARTAIYVVTATAAALIAWSAVAPIEEVSIATGRIVPASAISNIHHLEGGIVERVLAGEGDLVRRGETIVRLRRQQVAGDLGQLETRAAYLQLKWTRLDASLKQKEPEF